MSGQLFPWHRQGEQESHATKRDGNGKCRTDTLHVRLENAGEHLRREDVAKLRSAGGNHCHRIGARSRRWQRQNQPIDECRLPRGRAKGPSDGLEDCGNVN